MKSKAPDQTVNGLRKGDKVRHKNFMKPKWSHLTNGIIEDISLTGKSVYVDWYDEEGRKIHWAKYDCQQLEKL